MEVRKEGLDSNSVFTDIPQGVGLNMNGGNNEVSTCTALLSLLRLKLIVN